MFLSGCATLHVPKSFSTPAAPLNKSEAQAALAQADQARDQAQCGQAIKLWQAGKGEECRLLLDQILARNPREPQARRLLADLALEQGDSQRAEQLLLALVHDQPDDASARASLAWLYQSQDREAEARELFQQLDESFSPGS